MRAGDNEETQPSESKRPMRILVVLMAVVVIGTVVSSHPFPRKRAAVLNRMAAKKEVETASRAREDKKSDWLAPLPNIGVKSEDLYDRGIYAIWDNTRWYLRMGGSSESYGVNTVTHLQAWEKWDITRYQDPTGNNGPTMTTFRNRAHNRYMIISCGETSGWPKSYVSSMSNNGIQPPIHARLTVDQTNPNLPNYYRVSHRNTITGNVCYLQITPNAAHALHGEHHLGTWIHFT